MSELTEYGVGRTFYIPMPKQGSTDYAVAADWSPAPGDVTVVRDNLFAANIGTLPSYSSTYKLWSYQLTGTELTGKCIAVIIMDQGTKAVADNTILIETFGNSAAQFWYNFNLDNSALKGIFIGSPTSTGTTTTVIDTKLTGSDVDWYKGRILIALGTFKGQGSRITAYAPGSKTLTIDAMTQPLPVGEAYAIL
jgi:hypothetical protein